MKLLLTSEGLSNTSIKQEFLKLLGKPVEKAALTYIPTAANVEKGDKGWLVEDMDRFRKLGFGLFDIVDISAVSKDIWLPSFEKADVLVFGGGNVQHLLKWIEKSGVAKLFPDLLENKIYVGISAGSMVTATQVSLTSTNILYYEQTGTLKHAKGLGFVNFEIRPHLNSKWFPKVTLSLLTKLAEKTPTTFYAVDDNSAVSVVDNTVTIISEGVWKKFN